MTAIDGSIHAQRPVTIDIESDDQPGPPAGSDAQGPSDSSPTTISPPGRTATLSQEQILVVTERCLRSVGYDKTTIRKIAGELDCAVGSIYRYFKDKRELLFAVCQRRMERTARLIASGAELSECVLDYRLRVAEDPGSYRMMFWLAAVMSDEGDEGKAVEPSVPPVIREIVDAWAARLGSREMADRLWTSVHGSMMLGHDAGRTLEAAQSVLNRAGGGSPPPQAVAEPREVERARERAAEDVTLL